MIDRPSGLPGQSNLLHSTCMDILTRIKRLALARRIVLTRKAGAEMHADGLSEDDVIESIVSAHRIDKTLRSTSSRRSDAGERLYVIKGFSFSNVLVYTKGKIVKDAGYEAFYILVSSKRAF